jgi:hypothetical protein
MQVHHQPEAAEIERVSGLDGLRTSLIHERRRNRELIELAVEQRVDRIQNRSHIMKSAEQKFRRHSLSWESAK